MASSGGRIACPSCGANNFDTVTVCWKCGTPLRATAPSPAAYPGASPPGAMPAPAASAALQAGASPSALRAALWLGLLFPYFGLPVGFIFIMLDDSRKAEVGRACILWSCVSLVLHMLLLMLVGVGMREVLFAILQGARGAVGRSGGLGGYGVP